jgi:hypothetical protein
MRMFHDRLKCGAHRRMCHDDGHTGCGRCCEHFGYAGNRHHQGEGTELEEAYRIDTCPTHEEGNECDDEHNAHWH